MMKVCSKINLRILKRFCSLALAVILCVPMCVLPLPAHAAESIALPDTITPEMAKAFAEKLDSIVYDDNISASIVEIGPDKHPVLWLHTSSTMSDEIWIYVDGALKRMFQFEYYYDGSAGRWDMDNESSLNLYEYNGNRYFGVRQLVRSSSEYAEVDPESESELIREYGAYFDHSYRNEKTALYSIEANQWTEAYEIGYESAYAKEYLMYPGDFGDPFTWHIDLSTQFITTSDRHGWDMYYLDYDYYYVTERGVSKEITQNEYGNYASKVQPVHLESNGGGNWELQNKLKKFYMVPEYEFEDVLPTFSDEYIWELENLIRLFCDETESFEIATAENSDLYALAWDLVLFSEIPSMSDDYDEDLFQGKIVVSCDAVNQAVFRLTGRTVDFTDYQEEQLPSGDDISWFNLYVYEGNCYLYYFATALDMDYSADLQSLYALGNNIFLGNTIVSDQYEEEIFGTATVVFEKVGDDYHLLKIYPINATPSIEEVKQYAIKVNPEPNFKIDYSAVSQYTDLPQYVEALKTALAAAEPLNDAGNRAVTDYINYATQNYAHTVISAKDNGVVVSSETVKAVQESANEAKAALLEAVGGLSLFRTPTATVRIDVSGLDQTKPIRIRLDETTISAISGLDSIALVLGNPRHMVTIPIEGVRQLGYLDLQIEQLEQKNKYAISFFDQSEKVIDHLDANITFSLPASSEMSSVQVFCAGYSDNWGGQYDSQNQTITFQTSYTGEYTVLETTIQISDIDFLSDEVKRAILFMVSKGYFELDSEGRFNPSVGLNRYEFTQALVKIFFELNREAVTSFPDVMADNPYYPFVASGEENEILSGYDDGLFHGDDDLPRVQMLVICGSTLVNKKSYSRPDNPSAYLNYVDSSDIPNWSVDNVALTVREGLIESGGALRPNQFINRGEAALILYRLFMLLYEVSPTPITIVEASSAPTDTASSGAISPAVIGGIAVAGVGAVGGAAYYILGKKKLLKK